MTYVYEYSSNVIRVVFTLSLWKVVPICPSCKQSSHSLGVGKLEYYTVPKDSLIYLFILSKYFEKKSHLAATCQTASIQEYSKHAFTSWMKDSRACLFINKNYSLYGTVKKKKKILTLWRWDVNTHIKPNEHVYLITLVFNPQVSWCW